MTSKNTESMGHGAFGEKFLGADLGCPYSLRAMIDFMGVTTQEIADGLGVTDSRIRQLNSRSTTQNLTPTKSWAQLIVLARQCLAQYEENLLAFSAEDGTGDLARIKTEDMLPGAMETLNATASTCRQMIDADVERYQTRIRDESSALLSAIEDTAE